ncbi:MAG: hypothetical protein IT326_03835 [Anaerolineae bacterium]|nr:hypothetical protein [Anaerolineae bacterium]
MRTVLLTCAGILSAVVLSACALPAFPTGFAPTDVPLLTLQDLAATATAGASMGNPTPAPATIAPPSTPTFTPVVILPGETAGPTSESGGGGGATAEPAVTLVPTTSGGGSATPSPEPVVIPGAELVPTLFPQQITGPSAISIDETSFVDPLGTEQFVMLIANNGSVDLGSITVTLELYKPDGSPLLTQSISPNLGMLRVGEVSPAVILFSSGESAGWETYDVRVEASALMPGPDNNRYHDFTPLQAQGTALPGNVFSITGQVENTGSSNAESVRVIAILFGTQNELVGMATGFTDKQSIPAGNSSSFTILSVGGSATVARYVLLFEGTKAVQ